MVAQGAIASTSSRRAEPHVGTGTSPIDPGVCRSTIHHPQWMKLDSVPAVIQTWRPAKAMVSTRRHGPLRNSRAPTEHHGPTSWEGWAHLWEMKKAETRVFAGHGLDLWRARRDSNP